jgi:SAM-dependent methyltransferase
VSEVEDLRSIRRYEWRGIGNIVTSLMAPVAGMRWLDFGCGMGGLVEHCRDLEIEAFGHDEGWGADRARERGVPMLDDAQMREQEGTFDVVTAIEVIEHIADPVSALRTMRGMLRPGGLLFLTTGNARPYRGRIDRWAYVIPEIHVSFFEPQTMATALRVAGFRPERVDPPPGFTDVVRFKLLKNLRVRRRSRIEAALPWTPIARLVDRRFGISAHPLGWAA